MVTVKIRDDDILRDGETLRIHMMARDSSTQKTPVEIAIAATKLAMAGFNDAMRDSHRPGFRLPAFGTADAAAAASTARDAAYSDYEKRQSNAWRGTKDKVPPVGSYPADEADIGAACTIDGRPGTLQASDDDDFLICVAVDGNDNDDTTDSRVKARDAAYASYNSDIQDRWRNK
jgi:hypothetical protein